ncbi:MAG: hypothetical protein HRT58_22580 [Crocinitomicaceae bacterium]|nr:hypothetical protein [Flavobacteriales bacterium]NQZ38465.1 hypothetical protein [Crocinitomicaceae bacterium]
MKKFLFFILISFTGSLQAQEECPIAYVSDHYVLNNTDNMVTIWVNKRNLHFATKGPEKYDIKPGARIKISDLEWSGEFRDPTQWFVFKVTQKKLTPLCDGNNWEFKKIKKTEGEYTLTLEPTTKEPCKEVDEKLYFTHF